MSFQTVLNFFSLSFLSFLSFPFFSFLLNEMSTYRGISKKEKLYSLKNYNRVSDIRQAVGNTLQAPVNSFTCASTGVKCAFVPVDALLRC